VEASRVVPARYVLNWRSLVLLAAGLGIVLLSIVPAWLLHVRHVGGEGLTTITVVWSAWEGRAWPFLPIGCTLAAVMAAIAVASLVRPASVPRGLLPAVAIACAALLLGSLFPVSQTGFASSVDVTPQWASAMAAAVAVLAVVLAAYPLLATRRWIGAVIVALVVLTGATFAGRVFALNLAEGNGRHYSNGSYTRPASDAEPAESLVIRDGTYRVGERWSGTISGLGLVAVLTDDPACPDARGTYRVSAAGGEDIRWDLIVDLCAGGERARDLTTGTWGRDP
jgi:hypothetical protein